MAISPLGGGGGSSSAKLLAFYRLDGFAGNDAEVPAGAINGSNLTFSLAVLPSPAATLFLYKNGVFMVQGIDYTLGASAGSGIGVITMTAAPSVGDHLIAWYRTDGGTLGIADNEIPAGIINSVNINFTLAHNALASTLVLFRNGLSLTSGSGFDYSYSGTSIVMSTPPVPGDVLRAFYRYTTT